MWRSAKHQDICMSTPFPAVNGLPLGVGMVRLVAFFHEFAFGSIKLQMVVISPFTQIVNVYLKVLIVYWLLYGTIEYLRIMIRYHWTER